MTLLWRNNSNKMFTKIVDWSMTSAWRNFRPFFHKEQLLFWDVGRFPYTNCCLPPSFLVIKVRTVTQPYKALLLSNYSWYNNLCAPCRHLDAWPTFSWDSVHRQISWPFAFRISQKNTEFIALMESRSGTVPSHDGHYGAKQRFPSSRSKLV